MILSRDTMPQAGPEGAAPRPTCIARLCQSQQLGRQVQHRLQERLHPLVGGVGQNVSHLRGRAASTLGLSTWVLIASLVLAAWNRFPVLAPCAGGAVLGLRAPVPAWPAAPGGQSRVSAGGQQPRTRCVA